MVRQRMYAGFVTGADATLGGLTTVMVIWFVFWPLWESLRALGATTGASPSRSSTDGSRAPR
jgi:hypothetical protein